MLLLASLCDLFLFFRSIDPHIPTYPTSVRLYNVHNHNIFVAEALRHKDVGVKAIETLTQLFEVGHSPTSALAVLKSDLLAEHGNKYVYVSANRAICPDLQFCYRYVKFHLVQISCFDELI